MTYYTEEHARLTAEIADTAAGIKDSTEAVQEAQSRHSALVVKRQRLERELGELVRHHKPGDPYRILNTGTHGRTGSGEYPRLWTQRQADTGIYHDD